LEIFGPIIVLITFEAGRFPAGIWWPVDALGALSATLVVPTAAVAATLLAWLRHLRRPVPRAMFRPPLWAHAAQLGAFVLVCQLSDWVAFVQTVARDLPVLTTLLGVAPWLLGRVAAGQVTWSADRAGAHGGWTRAQCALTNAQVPLLTLLPLVLLNGLREGLLRMGGVRYILDSYAPMVSAASGLLLLPLFFAAAPLLVRFVLRARPLVEGPDRDRLFALARRRGVPVRDILVWDTRGLIPNAFFIGILPRLRYVVLTDAILAKLPPPLLDAVFAHELGHGARRHLLWFLLLACGFSAWMAFAAGDGLEVMGRMASVLGAEGEAREILATLASYALMAALLALFFGWGLGYVSRRFETEADLDTVGLLGSPYPIQESLESVGLHLGILHRRGGFRHFGIGHRIALVNRYLGEPDFRERFDRGLRRQRGLILFGILSGVLAHLPAVPRHLETGAVVHDLLQAREAGEVARLHEVESRIAALAVRGLLPPTGARALAEGARSAAADAHLGAGRYAEARAVLDGLAGARDKVAQFNRGMMTLILDTLEGRPDGRAADRLGETLLLWLRTGQGFDRDSLAESFTDLWLCRQAGGPPGAPPREERSEALGQVPASRLTAVGRLARAVAAGRGTSRELWKAARNEARRLPYRAALWARAFPDGPVLAP
jgi:Zn-dependent protease with chaperone function